MKVHIDVGELQDAIRQMESARLFTSPSKLYEALAQTNWARALGATPIMFYTKVKEVNTDPDNPVITMRTKPTRQTRPREPGAFRHRARVQIDVGELQREIDQLEAQQEFGSPSKLYEALAQTPWGQALDVSPTMYYLKIREVNTDPDNPVITMRVQPARKKGVRRTRTTGGTFAGINVLLETFRNRGIEITSVENLISSSHKSHDENRAIRLAWADLRDRLELPKPVKKTDPALSSVEPETALAEEITDQVVEISEEMPDGQPVFSQAADESEITPVEPEVFLDASLGYESVTPVPIPVPVARPVMSRPTPVRSSLPPRPMPVAGKQ
jgi:hypothetical protein